ncbi:hypothetical protein Glove_13g84 [Diversispora epigaea]|uniref:Uncharacterized protein n=1 Tax=Diversispora epigaea TaxID=1348612 RepID=A0A397JMU2_9GLOM|nr:hypothetical protein Glove_13g84 [Diversispora epigaea]
MSHCLYNIFEINIPEGCMNDIKKFQENILKQYQQYPKLGTLDNHGTLCEHWTTLDNLENGEHWRNWTILEELITLGNNGTKDKIIGKLWITGMLGYIILELELNSGYLICDSEGAQIPHGMCTGFRNVAKVTGDDIKMTVLPDECVTI